MASAFFAPNYFSARDAFLALARERGAQTESHPLSARGPAGEALSIDTAYFGPREPRQLLAIVSGTHGVEGFAGSALQRRWLSEHAVPTIHLSIGIAPLSVECERVTVITDPAQALDHVAADTVAALAARRRRAHRA